eukprot:7321063-Pyramimonas_sp.AAC.1
MAGSDPRGADVRAAALDLCRGFCQCRAMRLSRWFGVEFGFPARDWGVASCCGEGAQRDFPIDGDA